MYILFNALFASVCILCYYLFVTKKYKDKSIFLLTIAFVLLLLRCVDIGYLPVLRDNGNVFYTLAFGLYICYCIDKFIPFKKQRIREYLLLAPLVLYQCAPSFDYEFYGVLLITSLFVLKKHKSLQALAVVAWGFFTYSSYQVGYGFNLSWDMIFFVAISALLILLYNYKKGYNVKWFFYVFYPAHLLVLGIINVSLLFNAS